MKKLVLTLALILLSGLLMYSFGASMGQNKSMGGYTGATQNSFTLAKDVKNLRDNQYITLKGYIISKTGNEKYMFKDDSGTIQVEIDDEYWNGLNVNENDLVILEGEVERERNNLKVDINSIRLNAK